MTRDDTLYRTIHELFIVLGFYAQRLDALRAQANGNPWHRVLTPIYSELNGVLGEADGALTARVLSTETMEPRLPALHRLRAAYVCDKAVDEARDLITSDDAASGLKALAANAPVGAADFCIREGVTKGNVAVLGESALPLLSLRLLENTDCDVTCFVSDPRTCDLMGEVFIRTGFGDRVTLIRGVLTQGLGEAPFEAIVASPLLGVSAKDTNHPAKSQVLGRIFVNANRGAPMIVEDPAGLGILLYPSLDVERMTGMKITHHDPAPNSGQTLSTIVIKSR